MPGGMMSYESADDLKFYIKNGYCPENAGKTLQWAFEDWGLGMMASRLGKKAEAKEFLRRSHGWKKLYKNLAWYSQKRRMAIGYILTRCLVRDG